MVGFWILFDFGSVLIQVSDDTNICGDDESEGTYWDDEGTGVNDDDNDGENCSI